MLCHPSQLEQDASLWSLCLNPCFELLYHPSPLGCRINAPRLIFLRRSQVSRDRDGVVRYTHLSSILRIPSWAGRLFEWYWLIVIVISCTRSFEFLLNTVCMFAVESTNLGNVLFFCRTVIILNDRLGYCVLFCFLPVDISRLKEKQKTLFWLAALMSKHYVILEVIGRWLSHLALTSAPLNTSTGIFIAPFEFD